MSKKGRIIVATTVISALLVLLLLFNSHTEKIASKIASLIPLLSIESSEKVDYEGYIVRNWETMYFTNDLLSSNSENADKIWIKVSSNGSKELEENLYWQPLVGSSSDYTTVRIKGNLYGPGAYGHLGKFRYEIAIEEIQQRK